MTDLLSQYKDSCSVWLAIANQMLGSSLTIMPLMFIQYSLLTSIFASIAIWFFNLSTAQLFLDHNKSYEQDITDSVHRILGPGMYRVITFGQFLTLFLVGILYFSLSVNFFYSALSKSLAAVHIALPSPEEFTLSQPSYQYVAIFFVSAVFLMTQMRGKKRILTKMASVGVFVLILMTVFFVLRTFDYKHDTSNSN